MSWQYVVANVIASGTRRGGKRRSTTPNTVGGVRLPTPARRMPDGPRGGGGGAGPPPAAPSATRSGTRRRRTAGRSRRRWRSSTSSRRAPPVCLLPSIHASIHACVPACLHHDIRPLDGWTDANRPAYLYPYLPTCLYEYVCRCVHVHTRQSMCAYTYPLDNLGALAASAGRRACCAFKREREMERARGESGERERECV